MRKYDLESIMLQFQTSAQFVKSEAYGGGHINDTFKIEMKTNDESPICFILQRINHQVFKRPDKMMDNISRVTEHLRQKKNSSFKIYFVKQSLKYPLEGIIGVLFYFINLP